MNCIEGFIIATMAIQTMIIRDLAREIAHKKFVADNNLENILLGGIPNEIHQEILKIAIEIVELERDLAPNKIFSKGLLKAIKSKSYTSIVPNTRRNLWLDSYDNEGFLYALVITSEPKKGLVKIGATTMSPTDRAQKFVSKYGIDGYLYAYGLVRSPFKAEQELAVLLQTYRVSTNTFDDSNELYFDDALPIFMSFLSERADLKDIYFFLNR